MKIIARSSNLLGKIAILVMVSFVVNTAVALDGSGTQEDPWRIKSLDDFNDFAADANYWDDYARLETDVNLAGRTYNTAVIAPDTDNSNYPFDGTKFSGIFDGNDHKIAGLTIDDAGAGNDYLGLFGCIGEEGQVSNLGLEGASVSGTSDYVGGLAGTNNGSILNCYSTGHVSGRYWEVGGLVGRNDGSILNCYSTGNVDGGAAVGGLMGTNEGGIFSNCYSTGEVSGYEYVGGLVGENWIGDVSDCYSTGEVSGYEYVGGLVGWSNGTITYSYWDIETSNEPNMCGNEHVDCDNSYGLPTSQLHQQSTFTDWDFINVWNIGENQTYPYLRTYLPSDINKDGIVNFLDVAITANQWMEGH